ncbi:hypothetical protein QG7_3768 [Clostridioides difficile CD175]|nr:hypothetical protein HMPREF1122_02287 [Clostridioides difficile 002-P50-2011]EQF43819.1 hypothetical protein QG7_3768 [Clostridioides difficile CD175]
MSNVLDSLYTNEFQKNKHSYKKSALNVNINIKYCAIFLNKL